MKKVNREFTYSDSCDLAANLWGIGMNRHEIRDALEDNRFPTLAGDTDWTYGKTKTAIAKGEAKVSKVRSVRKAELQQAVRRPLKRMVSQTEWESMPEGMREALLDRLMARLG